ncbi:MAG: nuclear transport factor 2 family protein [Cyanobacteria bacterium SBLK]|nr:nuclear transport factor 2 family protein [Cyanobacteria bacterium SBLK]
MSQELRKAIVKAVETCQQRDAIQFAALFTLDAKLVLAGGQKIQGRDEIARVTADYFRSIEEIRIEIEEMNVNGDRAVIRWIWQARDGEGKQKRTENTIELSFRGEAIAYWQEAIE